MKQSFFLGGTSPSGFRSEFISQIRKPGYYTYILKGGPGTGKSTLMKKIASFSDESECELYYCSSDIKSLDAVVLENRKIIIADGTAPHTFDPFLPGISQEIINLGDFWNSTSLREHAELIRYYTEENSLYHKRAQRYLRSASALCSEIMNTADSALLKDKLSGFADRLSSKLFRSSCNKNASVEFRQLSSFTSYGYMTREISDEYTVYTLKDDLFAGSDEFLHMIADKACEHGFSVIVSECFAFEESVYEHLLIPELKTAFMSSGFLNKNTFSNSMNINFGRFYSKAILSERKSQINFNKKVISEISAAACEAIDTALCIHNELEKLYISTLDTECLNRFSDEFIKKIF